MGGRLRVGEWVEVKSEDEILATLDADGRLDGLPFMPEMLQYSGRRLQVYRSAHKTCDTVSQSGARGMVSAVHLDTRCDGSAHGGCQASCLLFWKEAWLRRVDGPAERAVTVTRPPAVRGGCTRATLDAATRQPSDPAAPNEIRYRCQATTLLESTTPIRWWDPRQYWHDWLSGNVSLWRLLRVVAVATFNMLQRKRGGSTHPRLPAFTLDKTPMGRLDLQPGEQVKVKSVEEIAKTLDRNSKNRGLWFDVEMVPFTGGTYRVRSRVERIIEERTGRMIQFGNPCIMLEGVECRGDFSRNRLLCPRGICPYWREIWLERTPPGSA